MMRGMGWMGVELLLNVKIYPPRGRGYAITSRVEVEWREPVVYSKELRAATPDDMDGPTSRTAYEVGMS